MPPNDGIGRCLTLLSEYPERWQSARRQRVARGELAANTALLFLQPKMTMAFALHGDEKLNCRSEKKRRSPITPRSLKTSLIMFNVCAHHPFDRRFGPFTSHPQAFSVSLPRAWLFSIVPLFITSVKQYLAAKEASPAESRGLPHGKKLSVRHQSRKDDKISGDSIFPVVS
ncbi:MAG: hypothetical protein PHR28_06155 [candidate division Zixibacteria bacterium]|nr:hypothetical protein [candidate division Zixibacteria bacterium]